MERATLRAARVGLVALVVTSGCALDPGGPWDPSGRTAPRGPAGDPYPDPGRGGYEDPSRDEELGRSPEERESYLAYDAGYTEGWQDREEGLSPDHTRRTPDAGYDGGRSYRTGYADGYQRRAHRYGEPGPDIQPVVPDWLIGEFRGWDDEADVEVVLRVDRDGAARLVGGGRAQDGAYRDGRLAMRKGSWRVQRMSGGVVIIPEWAGGAGVRLTRN